MEDGCALRGRDRARPAASAPGNARSGKCCLPNKASIMRTERTPCVQLVHTKRHAASYERTLNVDIQRDITIIYILPKIYTNSQILKKYNVKKLLGLGLADQAA